METTTDELRNYDDMSSEECHLALLSFRNDLLSYAKGLESASDAFYLLHEVNGVHVDRRTTNALRAFQRAGFFDIPKLLDSVACTYVDTLKHISVIAAECVAICAALEKKNTTAVADDDDAVEKEMRNDIASVEVARNTFEDFNNEDS